MRHTTGSSLVFSEDLFQIYLMYPELERQTEIITLTSFDNLRPTDLSEVVRVAHEQGQNLNSKGYCPLVLQWFINMKVKCFIQLCTPRRVTFLGNEAPFSFLRFLGDCILIAFPPKQRCSIS